MSVFKPDRSNEEVRRGHPSKAFTRNDRIPTAQGFSKLGAYLNALASRPITLCSEATDPFANYDNGLNGLFNSHFFVFRTGPTTQQIQVVSAHLPPVSSGTTTEAWHAWNLRVGLTSVPIPSAVQQAKSYHPGHRDAALTTAGHLYVLSQKLSVTPSTDYVIFMTRQNRTAVVSVTVVEYPRHTLDSAVDLAVDQTHLVGHNPILAEDALDLYRLAREIRARAIMVGGASAGNASPDSLQDITSATKVNLFATSVTSASPSSPGFTLSVANHGRLNSTSVGVMGWIWANWPDTNPPGLTTPAVFEVRDKLNTILATATFDSDGATSTNKLICVAVPGVTEATTGLDWFVSSNGTDQLYIRAAGFWRWEGLVTPLDVPGCVGWWDAEYLTGARVTAADDNTTVTTWNDLSGQGYHLVQATAANKPTLQTSEINGRAVVRFDGTDDYLHTDYGVDPVATKQSAITVFVVSRATGTAGTLIGYVKTANLAPWDWAIRQSAANATELVQDANTTTYTRPTGLSAYHQEASIISWSTGPNLFSLNTNEVQDGTDRTISYPNARAINVGADDTLSSRYTGDIAAMLIYNRALTPSEAHAVTQWLALRFAVSKN